MPKKTEQEEREKALPIIALFGVGALGALAWWLLRKPPVQPDKAILYGLVTDIESHTAIPNINVDCGGYTGKTDAEGNYRIINIPPGEYTVNFTDPLGHYEPTTV